MIFVVLGAGVDKRGKLSKETLKRLREVFLIYKERGLSILLCGKYGFPIDEKKLPPFTEAQIMQRQLISWGVKEKDTLLENNGQDTILSAYYAKKDIFIPQKKKEMTIITSDIQLNRVEFIFYKVFGEDYKIYTKGVPSHLPCKGKGLILEKQRMLDEKTKIILDKVAPGDHETARRKALEAQEKGLNNIQNPNIENYKKTC